MKCGKIVYSVKEIRQQKEQWGWKLELMGKGGCTKLEGGRP